jgi:hypothetical protein
MTTLNGPAYKRLVEEDLKWLLAQPRTLERDHIETILRRGTYTPRLIETLQIIAQSHTSDGVMAHGALRAIQVLEQDTANNSSTGQEPRMTTTDSTTTPARAPGTVAALVRWCSIGDTIETTMSDGSVRRVTIPNAMACAEANELIAAGRWRVVDTPNAEAQTRRVAT